MFDTPDQISGKVHKVETFLEYVATDEGQRVRKRNHALIVSTGNIVSHAILPHNCLIRKDDRVTLHDDEIVSNRCANCIHGVLLEAAGRVARNGDNCNVETHIGETETEAIEAVQLELALV